MVLILNRVRRRKTRRRHPNVRLPTKTTITTKPAPVMNLTDIELTEDETSVLKKGLSFIPTPHGNLSTLQQSIDQYKRTLRLDYLYQGQDRELNPFKKKSSYTPTTSNNKTLEKYLEDTELALHTTCSTPSFQTSSNLTPGERRAVQSLRDKMHDVIIKKADKGSTITVVTRGKYIADGLQHLSDMTAYAKLDNDPTPTLAAHIKSYICELQNTGYIDKTEAEYLLPPDPVQTQYIYFPYKIHKSPISVRPVVSGINGATTAISSYLDHFFKSKVPLIPSFLKNSQSLVTILKSTPIPPSDHVFLVSIDVKSLYTTIPQDEGIEAILKHNEAIGLPKFITRQLLNFILKNNIFTFNATPYQQRTGVAMGTPLAPTLANLFMATLEERFLKTQDKQPLIYKRYIDDIFIVWTHSMADFQTFFANLNGFHPTIKYEYSISETSIDYLDITIYKGDQFAATRRLSTKTHFKPTNSFQYIHYTSHHPLNTKTAIIKAEILRYQRQCSDPKDFKHLKQQLINHFIDRGYPFNIINKIIISVTSQPRNQLTTLSTSPYPFTVHYDARRNHPIKALKLNLDHLERDATTFHMARKRLVIAYRNKSNIKKIITKSPLNTDAITNNITPEIRSYHIPLLPQPCNKSNCRSCPDIITTNTFKCTTTGLRIPIQHHLSCESSNIIYVLQCKICKLQYVGVTTSTLRERVNQHRSRFRSSREPRQLIYKHFDQHGAFRVSIIPLMRVNPEQRFATEEIWINRLNSRTPYGLNDVYM